ncbi:MAG: hypothetical protein JNN05_03830 [Candidatus Omnitrophica bacterium]|nr:hypothetical protein [Candidatus Omnitrophota bacterium]
MKKLSTMEIVILSAALIFIPFVTRAALEEGKVITGVVQAVENARILLIAQPTNNTPSNIMDFQIQPRTNFQGFSKSDLKVGDRVKIGYFETGQGYIADSVINTR